MKRFFKGFLIFVVVAFVALAVLDLLHKAIRAQDPTLDLPRDLQVFQGYMVLVERFSGLAKDETSSGVAAVFAASDLLKERGAQAKIDYFNELLPHVKNSAVRRTIRLQLVEAYRSSGHEPQALAHLQSLMTGDETAITPTTSPSE